MKWWHVQPCFYRISYLAVTVVAFNFCCCGSLLWIARPVGMTCALPIHFLCAFCALSLATVSVSARNGRRWTERLRSIRGASKATKRWMPWWMHFGRILESCLGANRTLEELDMCGVLTILEDSSKAQILSSSSDRIKCLLTRILRDASNIFVAVLPFYRITFVLKAEQDRGPICKVPLSRLDSCSACWTGAFLDM